MMVKAMLRFWSVRRMLFLVLLMWGVVILTVFQLLSQQVETTIKQLVKSIGSRLATNTEIIMNISSIIGIDYEWLEWESSVDKSPVHTVEMVFQDVQRKIPSLPIDYWIRHKNKAMFHKNDSCAKLPSIFELQFSNIYWQNLQTSNGTFQLYGAYYDNRELSEIGPAVRILGMINRFEPTVKTYCQLWFESQTEPVFMKVMEYKYIWNRELGNYEQGIFQPYLMACQIPEKYHKLVPAAVSIVEEVCDTATNNLRIIFNKPEEKKDFAVCVKGLDFLYEDLSVRLVEWIEMLTILGADKIFFYELQVHPNITKVLQYYESTGRVEVTPLTLPGGQPNVPGLQHIYLLMKLKQKRQNELIPYNDCLYKNLYTYKYIALLDIDEVIMPVNFMTWKELMDRVKLVSRTNKYTPLAFYVVRHVYYLHKFVQQHGLFKDIPRYMHMLQHVYRSKNFTKPFDYVKCFYNPKQVLTLFHHAPLACLGRSCPSYNIDTADAQLQHYRADCANELKNYTDYCESVLDTTIWKYKERLTRQTTDVLIQLGFFGSRDVQTHKYNDSLLKS